MVSTARTGLSIDRVQEPNSQILKYLECPICLDILWKPVACQSCEKPFCSACIHDWLRSMHPSCPTCFNIFVERRCPSFIVGLLSQLQLSCIYETNGCNERISYEALEKHENECNYQLLQSSGCCLYVLRKHFNDHKNNCPSIELKCERCKLVYKRDNGDKQHTDSVCLQKENQSYKQESKQKDFQIQQLTIQLNQIRTSNSTATYKTIMFEDLPATSEYCCAVPYKYQDLLWTDFSYLHKSYVITNWPSSGYAAYFQNGNNTNIVFLDQQAFISSKESNRTFTILSINALAAWNDDLKLTLIGYRKSTAIVKCTTTLLFGIPQTISLNWKDIDRIVFISFGGTPHPGSRESGGSQAVLTEIVIHSEPVVKTLFRCLQDKLFHQ